jgi:hypothetical protein
MWHRRAACHMIIARDLSWVFHRKMPRTANPPHSGCVILSGRREGSCACRPQGKPFTTKDAKYAKEILQGLRTDVAQARCLPHNYRARSTRTRNPSRLRSLASRPRC